MFHILDFISGLFCGDIKPLFLVVVVFIFTLFPCVVSFCLCLFPFVPLSRRCLVLHLRLPLLLAVLI